MEPIQKVKNIFLFLKFIKIPKGLSITYFNLIQLFCILLIFVIFQNIIINIFTSNFNDYFINLFFNYTLKTTNLLFLAFFLLFLFYILYELYWKRRFLPPGPVPFLIAGNMPQVILHGASNIDLLLQKWNKYYGGIFTFWMGPIPMVMVSDVNLLKYYFIRNGDVFSGRWQNFITNTFMDGHNGIIQIQGDKWREQRRFSLHVLRDFGFGRTEMEEKIKMEVRSLIAHLNNKFTKNPKNTKTEAFDLSKPVAVCIANIINSILFSRTYAHDDPSFIRVQQMLDEQSSLVVKPIMGLYLSFPWTINLPLLNSSWKKLLKIRNDFWLFLEKHINEHLIKFNYLNKEEMPSSDFIFAYLNEIKRRKKLKNDQNDDFNNNLDYFNEKQLKMLLLDLFFAGSETTVTTTKWGIILLILHPQVQERCFNEIINKIGQNEPDLKDRSQLIYLSATICEIQRIANILPINLLRTCLEDIKIDNFLFKAGTMVLPQISITMNDSNYFNEPNKFNPERFIEINKFGELTLKRIEAFLPFSIGKRQCLGESLARAELFFIFSYLIKNFKFLPESEKVMPSTKRIYGLTCSPQPFKCCLIARNLI